MTRVTKKQTFRSLSLSYQKKGGRAWPCLSFFWYDTDFSEFVLTQICAVLTLVLLSTRNFFVDLSGPVIGLSSTCRVSKLIIQNTKGTYTFSLFRD